MKNYQTLYDLVQSQDIDLEYEHNKLVHYFNKNIDFIYKSINTNYINFPLRGRTSSLQEFISLVFEPKLNSCEDLFTEFLLYSDFLYNAIRFQSTSSNLYGVFDFPDQEDLLILSLIKDILKFYNYEIIEDYTIIFEKFYRIRKINSLVENLIPYFEESVSINLINFNFYDNTWEQKSKYIEDLYKKFEEIRPKIRGTAKADELASIVNSYIRHPNVPDNQFLFDWASDYSDKNELMDKIYNLIIEVFYVYVNLDFKKEIKDVSKGAIK